MEEVAKVVVSDRGRIGFGARYGAAHAMQILVVQDPLAQQNDVGMPL